MLFVLFVCHLPPSSESRVRGWCGARAASLNTDAALTLRICSCSQPRVCSLPPSSSSSLPFLLAQAREKISVLTTVCARSQTLTVTTTFRAVRVSFSQFVLPSPSCNNICLTQVCGASHSLALVEVRRLATRTTAKTWRALLTWGHNAHGALGTDDTNERKTPTPVSLTFLSPSLSVEQICAGPQCTLLLERRRWRGRGGCGRISPLSLSVSGHLQHHHRHRGAGAGGSGAPGSGAGESAASASVLRKREEVELKAAGEWSRLESQFRSVGDAMDKSQAHTFGLVRRGIPASVRRRVWPALIGNTLRITMSLWATNLQRAVAQASASRLPSTFQANSSHNLTCSPYHII